MNKELMFKISLVLSTAIFPLCFLVGIITHNILCMVLGAWNLYSCLTTLNLFTLKVEDDKVNSDTIDN